MNSESILYWEQFLSELKKEEIPNLRIALDKSIGIINAANPTDENKEILFNGEINPHIFRAHVEEGWIEQLIPVKTASGDIIYDVKNGYPTVERHYGKVEVI